MIERALTILITGVVCAGVAALLVGIAAANVYAILHAWRSERIGWVVVLTVLFVTGGSIATAVYLIVHWDEPLPRRSVSRMAEAA
jgi:hypothetical protein